MIDPELQPVVPTRVYVLQLLDDSTILHKLREQEINRTKQVRKKERRRVELSSWQRAKAVMRKPPEPLTPVQGGYLVILRAFVAAGSIKTLTANQQRLGVTGYKDDQLRKLVYTALEWAEQKLDV